MGLTPLPFGTLLLKDKINNKGEGKINKKSQALDTPYILQVIIGRKTTADRAG